MSAHPSQKSAHPSSKSARDGELFAANKLFVANANDFIDNLHIDAWSNNQKRDFLKLQAKTSLLQLWQSCVQFPFPESQNIVPKKFRDLLDELFARAQTEFDASRRKDQIATDAARELQASKKRKAEEQIQSAQDEKKRAKEIADDALYASEAPQWEELARTMAEEKRAIAIAAEQESAERAAKEPEVEDDESVVDDASVNNEFDIGHCGQEHCGQEI
jgi:hypothetical protein